MNDKLNNALEFLRGKYGFPAGRIAVENNVPFLHLADGKTVRLLPWRVERRFTELKKIIDSATVEDVSTFRFANFTAGGCLEATLQRELDLAAFLSGSEIVSLFATCGGEHAANVIFRLANGMSGCIECGNRMPAGSEPVDRHEIIARRGVASDRGVDTQVPQSSIYCWTEAGEKRFTDVDTELFGLSNDEIWIVRAAYAILTHPELGEVWNHAAEAMQRRCSAVFGADKNLQVEQF